MDKIYLTWNDIDVATDNIVSQIKEKCCKTDAIMGIPRGGLVIAVILSHKLNIPYVSQIHQIKKNSVFLIVDDISDTGETFRKILNHWAPLTLAKKIGIITASIHIAPNTSFIPTIFYQKTVGEWIVYPWETDDTSKVDYKEKYEKHLEII